MKRLLIAAVIAAALIGCNSKEERVLKRQVQICKDNFEEGLEVTPWCAEKVPELKQYLPAPQPQALPAPQYIEQAPVQYAQQPAPAPATGQPVIVNNQPAGSSGGGFAETFLGAAAGSMVGNAMSSQGGQTPQSRYVDDYRPSPRPRPVIQNITIKEAPKPVTKPVPAPAPKKNYMDTSKFGSVGTKPKVSGMNTSRFGSAGRR